VLDHPLDGVYDAPHGTNLAASFILERRNCEKMAKKLVSAVNQVNVHAAILPDE
jgi:hypothetical protein